MTKWISREVHGLLLVTKLVWARCGRLLSIGKGLTGPPLLYPSPKEGVLPTKDKVYKACSIICAGHFKECHSGVAIKDKVYKQIVSDHHE